MFFMSKEDFDNQNEIIRQENHRLDEERIQNEHSVKSAVHVGGGKDPNLDLII